MFIDVLLLTCAALTRMCLQMELLLPWEKRLELLQGVAAGMRYLHRQGWRHGCLRSTQLFLGSDGQVGTSNLGCC